MVCAHFVKYTSSNTDSASDDTQTSGLEFVLTENPQLNDTLAQFEMPVVSYSTIESDGYGKTLSAVLRNTCRG